MKVRVLAALGLAALLCFLPGAAYAAEAKPLDKVTLQLKWRHQFQFAGYYAAMEKGFYRDAGLDVQLIEGSPDRDPTSEVIAGKADFGVGNSDLLIMRHEGKPVVVLAVIFQHSPLVLLVRTSSGAKDVQALFDKKMMWIPSEGAEIKALFKYEGVDPTKLNWRPHTYNIEDFINGTVDAMSAYSTDEPDELRRRGVAFYSFMPRAGGIDFYGDCLFTTEEQISDHPDRVRAFRNASLKGWEYALAHPEEIVDLIMAKYNTQNKPREHYLFEARETADLMHPGLIEVGHMNPGRWRHIADTYAEFGMLPTDYTFEGFLFDPNPKPDYSWLYWTLGIVSGVAVAALGWALPLLLLNHRLRNVIARQRVLQVELVHAKDVAEAADAAKSHYLAVMTHEVRSPLSGIISLSEMLQHEQLTLEQKELVALMQNTSEDMLKLINDVLEYSKAEAGKMTLEPAPLELGTFLEDLHRLYLARAHDRKLEFRLRIAPEVPAFVVTDSMRLRQVLGNLLANALKFTERGTITMEVTAKPEPSAGSSAPRWRIFFAVRDSGIGIAPEQAVNLFNPYAQANAGIAKKYGGTGLGLAISHQLAKLLGGELRLAESTPGKGSCFVLEIAVSESLAK